MDPRSTPALETDELPDPIDAEDWDGVDAGELILQDGELLSEAKDGALPEEDDDNPMQDSDDALPDDQDERVLRRNPSKEGSRFDEV